MPIQLSDDLFEHLTPPDTVDWVLDGVHIPRNNPKSVMLKLAWAGRGSAYLIEMAKLKPLADKQAATERAIAMFARLAVKGWENVLDEEKSAPFQVSVCVDILLRYLRARKIQGIEELDSMIRYAANPLVFRRDDRAEAPELGEG